MANVPTVDQKYGPVFYLRFGLQDIIMLGTAQSASDLLVYGIRLPTGTEPEVKAVGEVVRRVLQAAQVGTWVIDALPILNYLWKFLAP